MKNFGGKNPEFLCCEGTNIRRLSYALAHKTGCIRFISISGSMHEIPRHSARGGKPVRLT